MYHASYLNISFSMHMNMNFRQTDNMPSGKSIAVKTQLITVINDWVKILDKSGQVDTFIFDFDET